MPQVKVVLMAADEFDDGYSYCLDSLWMGMVREWYAAG
jgi:hypothetical protein